MWNRSQIKLVVATQPNKGIHRTAYAAGDACRWHPQDQKIGENKVLLCGQEIIWGEVVSVNQAHCFNLSVLQQTVVYKGCRRGKKQKQLGGERANKQIQQTTGAVWPCLIQRSPAPVAADPCR
jgi:hypothetical protein